MRCYEDAQAFQLARGVPLCHTADVPWDWLRASDRAFGMMASAEADIDLS